MSIGKRRIALLLLVGMLLILFASSALIIREAHHDCPGEDCPVCAFLAQAIRVQRSFSVALALVLLLFATLRVRPLRAHAACFGMPSQPTLIDRKIRLND
ncbi:MAG: hypothetical protein E7317_09395 [Clostridiales bacterium]|nr:hypothetical protein [Clostridiales bacterium]